MTTTQNKLGELRQACEFKTDEDFGAYTEAIEFLREHPSSEVLAGMFRCLTDIDAGEIQYELIEACEAYPDEGEYLRILGENAREVRSRSPEWGGLLLQSALDTPSCCEALYQLASERREGFTDLWDWVASIADREPKYTAVVAEIARRMGRIRTP